MSFFSKKKGRLSGPGDMSKHLWHYDGANSYEEFDERDSGIFSFGKSKSEYTTDDSKLTHYMAAGGMRYENGVKQEGPKPLLHRVLIIKWLIGLALFWLVFRFVVI